MVIYVKAPRQLIKITYFPIFLEFLLKSKVISIMGADDTDTEIIRLIWFHN